MKLINAATLAAALAALTLTASGLATIALVNPSNPVGDYLGLAEVHERRATALLVNPQPSFDQLDRAAFETHRSLALAPANPRPWLRLAYIESRRSGQLTQTGLEHLERSYVLAPYGPDDSPWRLSFMFEHWDRLTPELRQFALRELALQRREAGQHILTQVTNPQGRLALAVMLEAPDHPGTTGD